MSEMNSTTTAPDAQWTRKNVFIEYEVSTPLSPLSQIPGLFSVRFPCGWGGTGATEIAALQNGIETVRFFKRNHWLDALSMKFDEADGTEGVS